MDGHFPNKVNFETHPVNRFCRRSTSCYNRGYKMELAKSMMHINSKSVLHFPKRESKRGMAIALFSAPVGYHLGCWHGSAEGLTFWEHIQKHQWHQQVEGSQNCTRSWMFHHISSRPDIFNNGIYHLVSAHNIMVLLLYFEASGFTSSKTFLRV